MIEQPSTRATNWIKLAAVVVGIVGGIAALLLTVFPNFGVGDADLRIVSAYVEEDDGNSRIVIKLTNRGGSMAFVTRGVLEFGELTVTEDDGNYAAEIQPTVYDWLIVESDTHVRESRMPLARRIDPNDADHIQFTLGYDVPRRSLSGTVQVRLYYNESDSVETGFMQVSVSNVVGRVPKLRQPTDSEQLLVMLDSDLPARSLREAIEWAAGTSNGKVSDTVALLLEHREPEVRMAAAEYFGKVSRPQFIPVLVDLLLDAEPTVVAAAKRAMPTYGADVLPDLRALINSSIPARRELALAIVTEINDDSSEALLRSSIRDVGVAKTVFGKEVIVAATAVGGLARIGSSSAIAAIRELLHSNDPRLLAIAIQVLADLCDQEALAALDRLANEGPETLREIAAEAAAQIRGC